MKPLAKPTGVLLEDHIRNLLDQADALLATRPFVAAKYQTRTGEDLVSALKQSARWHDEGKKHEDWQRRCRLDHEEFLRTGIDRAPNLRKGGLRHELVSLVFIEHFKANVSQPVRVAVAAHHGKLSRRDKHAKRWQERKEFQRYWQEFAELHHTLRASIDADFEEAIRQRYRFSGPRAWLQLIDHRASAHEQGELLPQFRPFAYKFPHAEKRGVQEIIPQLWDEPFAILRAPTGAGKTDAALLWAQRQIDQGRADHLVIAMPTRFTANALSIGVSQENFKNLGDLGLYHSSAWYQRLKESPTPTQSRFTDKEQDLARRLETPLTVTTIDHLCICLTATREDHHAVFFGLAHSCVVIDEADFYDDFTQQNIVVLLRTLRELGVPVLLMSATVPESARTVYATSGVAVPPIFEDKTDYTRTRCHIKRFGKAEMPSDVEELLDRALDGTPTIIYANTVARAQAYYRWFKSLHCSDVVLYHSRFIEPHKVEKERLLIEMLGRQAWAEGKQRGVAILTQIGEISVNISADLMIADLCPLDRLAQRAGRLARFTKQAGELFVVEPYRLNKRTGEVEFYPAPYGHFAPGVGWLAGDALLKSDERLREGDYSAKTFVDLVNEVYPAAPEIEPHVRDNQRALEDCVIGNWLLLPAEKVEGDDDHTMNWKCRDIPPQYTIYAGYEMSGIIDEDAPWQPRNKTELREWETRHGVNIHAYEFIAAVTNQWLSEVKFVIGDETVTRLVVRKDFYSEERGLDFTRDVEDDY